MQVRTLEIPVDSAIAVNTRSQQLQNKQEQEQLKRLVSHLLGYSLLLLLTDNLLRVGAAKRASSGAK